MRDADLMGYFSYYGDIVDCKVMEGRGFGFITYRVASSAEALSSTNHWTLFLKSIRI